VPRLDAVGAADCPAWFWVPDGVLLVGVLFEAEI
jgi:hypothetical protein